MLTVSKLTLRGFKSFGKPTVIEFKKGFTAIVGPNGSGKSNLIDAICFVLGRMSTKSLRADRMTELIFNGSKASKPSSKAEVLMKFDNRGGELPVEEKDLEVSREILKDGKCDYYISAKKSTRQQIVDILSKGRINPNGHNIILQGDVMEIMGMSAEEKRKMIDEISGIAEYDAKKQKALNELEKVEHKISDAKSVCLERERYLKDLEKERDDALRFQELDTEVKKCRAENFKIKIGKAEKELAQIKEQLAEQNARKEEINKEIAANEEGAKSREQEVREIDEELEKKGEKERAKLQNEIKSVELQVATTKQNIQAKEEFTKTSEKRAFELESQLTELTKKEEETQKELAQEEKKRAEKEEALAKEEKALLQLRKQITAGDEQLAKKLEERTRAVEAITKQVHGLELEKEKTREFIRLKKQELLSLENRKKEALPQLESLEKEKTQLEGRLEELRKKNGKNGTEVEKLEGDLLKTASEIARLEAEADTKRKEAGKLQAEEQVRREYHSYHESVKEILHLRNTGKIKGIHGTISELGKASDKHAIALEVAAGNRLQNIVVENEQVAIDCINHLREQKKGKATFLPLDRLHPPRITGAPKEAIGLAIDLVEFEDKYLKAFEYVFTDTIIVQDINTCRQVGVGTRRMATLTGDLVEASGAMTGGYHTARPVGFAIKEQTNQLDTLRGEIQKMEAELDAHKLRHAELKKITERTDQEFSVGTRELEKFLGLKESIDLRIDSFKETVGEETREKIAGEIGESEKNLQSTAEKLKALDEAQQKAIAELKEAESEADANKKEEFGEELKKLETAVKEKTHELNTITLRLNTLNSQLEHLITAKIIEFRREIETLAKARTKSAEEKENLTKKIAELSATLEETKKMEGDFFQKTKERQERKRDIQKEMDKLRAAASKLYGRQRDVEKAANTLEIESARVETRLAEIQKSAKEYSLEGVEIKHSERELEEKIIKLEKELASLGNINMLALDQFDRLKEDYEELKKKMDKLIGEKQAVLNFMAEVEKSKKDTFMQTFLEISGHFEETFKKLSPGGSAHLLLENPEDPFAGGLEIQAKPKGKELQNMTALSGGEKTLTALAYIFAMQQVRPAPFYVLDEVDAALDKVNSEALGNMIAELAKNKTAQFIVISHNDAVYSKADTLYGVTMSENGSQIVGVEMP